MMSSRPVTVAGKIARLFGALPPASHAAHTTSNVRVDERRGSGQIRITLKDKTTIHVGMAEMDGRDNALQFARCLYAEYLDKGSSKTVLQQRRDDMYAKCRKVREESSQYSDHLYVKSRSDGFLKIGRSINPERDWSMSSSWQKHLPEHESNVVRTILILPYAGYLEQIVLDQLTFEGLCAVGEACDCRANERKRPAGGEWMQRKCKLKRICEIVFSHWSPTKLPSDLYDVQLRAHAARGPQVSAPSLRALITDNADVSDGAKEPQVRQLKIQEEIDRSVLEKEVACKGASLDVDRANLMHSLNEADNNVKQLELEKVALQLEVEELRAKLELTVKLEVQAEQRREEKKQDVIEATGTTSLQSETTVDQSNSGVFLGLVKKLGIDVSDGAALTQVHVDQIDALMACEHYTRRQFWTKLKGRKWLESRQKTKVYLQLLLTYFTVGPKQRGRCSASTPGKGEHGATVHPPTKTKKEKQEPGTHDQQTTAQTPLATGRAASTPPIRVNGGAATTQERSSSDNRQWQQTQCCAPHAVFCQ